VLVLGEGLPRTALEWRDFESDIVEASSSLSFVVPAGLRGWRFADRQHSALCR
jgi:hypothetical protein